MLRQGSFSTFWISKSEGTVYIETKQECSSKTEQGERFENVPTVIMVYISEFDFLKGNRTIYHIDHVIREIGTAVDNGLHAVCVNTKIDDRTDIEKCV